MFPGLIIVLLGHLPVTRFWRFAKPVAHLGLARLLRGHGLSAVSITLDPREGPEENRGGLK